VTLRFPLYLRIWFAVVIGVAVLTLAAGWLVHQMAEDQQPQPRDVIIRNDAGDVLGQARTVPIRVPGQGVEFQVAMNNGSTVTVQLPPRPRMAGEPPQPQRRGPWGRGSTPFLLMLSIVGLAVAIATYPIIRRLTQRLEDLRRGVERWGEGDLTARVQERGNDEVAFLASRFNHAAQRVELLVRSHKSLLANASHELRSPLARIRMGLELMEGPPSETQRREMLRNIGELDQLIEEILLASRLDARESDIGTFEEVHLTGLAAEECARVGADLEAAQDGGCEVAVQGVAKLLRRAIRNLLENARRYSNGPVEVEIRREGGDALVRVCDRGPGVPPDQRERIFEPFYRLPGASEREGGVGLGLALVRSIAQRHHGSVQCEGREGGGACFVLRLPAA
jgi:two-component system OmpR family sensor kinase